MVIKLHFTSKLQNMSCAFSQSLILCTRHIFVKDNSNEYIFSDTTLKLSNLNHSALLKLLMHLQRLLILLQYRSNSSWQSLETRTFRLDPRNSKTRVSSLESRRQRIYRSINFSKYMYMSSLRFYFRRQGNFKSRP